MSDNNSQANFRINTEIKDDFEAKAKKTKLELKPGQSKREIVAEKLMEKYTIEGDDMFIK